MQNLLRGIILVFLLAIASTTVLAIDDTALSDHNSGQGHFFEQTAEGDANIRVIPDEGAAGSNHVILITGLEDNETVTVRIVSEDSGSVVYETQQTANRRGIVEVDIFSEEGDEGEYTVEVLNADDDIIGSESLTIFPAETFDPVIIINPLEAEAGTTFTIEITDIRPFAVLEVIIETELGVEVFTQELRATVDGTATISFDSDNDSTGILEVRIIEGGTNILLNTEITVLGELFPSIIIVEPQEALPGDMVFVTISGLEADTDHTIHIVLNDETLETIEDTANVSGLIIFPYTFTEDAQLGRYEILVFQGGEQVGLETLEVDIPPVTVDISPPIGTVGTVFVATISDLRPNDEVTVELMLGDEIVQARTALADAEGIARTTLGQRVDLEIADYTVRVIRVGEQVFTQSIEVAEVRPETIAAINPDDVTVTVNPESGLRPTTYTLTVEGVPADTDLTLFILLDNQSVLSLSGTADANGMYSTQINSEESDPPGVYTLEVRAEGVVIGSADFEIADENSETSEQDDDDDTPIGSSDIQIDIDPATLRQGERVEIVIRNLEADETVTVEVLFDGDVVYSADRRADANGATAIALLAADDDATGEYQIRILRGDDLIAESTFELVDSDAQVSAASLSVSPETVAQGNEFVISVSGLASGETAMITVSIDDEMVFETERQADANGNVTVVLTPAASDELGVYDITVSRDDGADLEASVTVIEGDPEPERDAEISIEPDSGEIGTTHEITVTGLNPDETFTFSIEFDGDSVYSVERTADEDGVFVTSISAAEGDPIGDYEIIFTRDNADDVTAILTVEGAEEILGDIEINIEPDEVNEQEPFEILISGLAEDESIIIEVEFDGEVVYETERSADEDGQVSLTLSTDEGDPTGTYTINVIRGDQVVSADVLVLESDDEIVDEDEVIDEITDAEQDDPDSIIPDEQDVEISVDPVSAELGEEYEFVVSGLDSNEEFVIVVIYDDEIVFETMRTADASGFYTISLQSSEDDEAGLYTFAVIRDDEIVASVEFEVVVDAIISGDGGDDDQVDEDSLTGADDPTDDTLGNDGQEVSSSYADPVTLEFDADATLQVIEFEGQAGDVISISVDSDNSIDTVATLVDPNGIVIASDDDGGLGFDPEIERAVLPITGTYRLEVRPFIEGDAGTASVTINQIDRRQLENNDTVLVQLNSKTTNDILIIDGQAGDVISLVIDLESGEVANFAVSAEQGEQTLMSYQTFGLPQTIVLGFVIPEDGNVVIRFSDDGSASANLNVSIERE